MTFLKSSNDNVEDITDNLKNIFSSIREKLYKDYNSIISKYYIVFQDILKYRGIEGAYDATRASTEKSTYEQYLQKKFNERFSQYEEGWVQKTLLNDSKKIEEYHFSNDNIAILFQNIKNVENTIIESVSKNKNKEELIDFLNKAKSIYGEDSDFYKYIIEITEKNTLEV